VSDWVFGGDGGRESASIVDGTATDYGVSVATNASANTKGNYASLTSSLPIAAQGGFWWNISTTVGAFDFSFDLAVGTAGNEKIIIPDMFFAGSAEVNRSIFMPLQIPAGSTVRARGQSTTGTKASLHSVTPVGLGWLGSEMPQRCESLGVTTSAATHGVSVTPNATINTKGSYAAIGTSNFAYRFLLVILGFQLSGARTGSNARLDIAVGTAGSEQVILPNLRYRNCNTTQEPVKQMFLGPFPVGIAGGTSISARCQADQASALAIDVALLGFGG